MKSNGTILIVDNEAINRQCVRTNSNTNGGWKVLQSDTGISGLATAKEEQPGLILLDVTMAKIDGNTGLQELQLNEATRDIPVIMFTSLSGDSGRRIYGESGATWLISKPFDLIVLPNQVETILSWSS